MQHCLRYKKTRTVNKMAAVLNQQSPEMDLPLFLPPRPVLFFLTVIGIRDISKHNSTPIPRQC